MNRLKGLGLLAIIAFLPAGGCGPSGDASSGAGVAGNYYGQGSYDCSQYAACGACTSANGCGWCAYANGSGACTTGPDACGTSAFTWTWDDVGCPGATSTDAGAAAPDGGVRSQVDAGSTGDAASTYSTSDASATIDAPPSSTAEGEAGPPAGDASTGACTSNGGSLCGTVQPFGFTCTRDAADASIPAPAPALGCAVVTAPTPANTLYYCCTRSQ